MLGFLTEHEDEPPNTNRSRSTRPALGHVRCTHTQPSRPRQDGVLARR